MTNPSSSYSSPQFFPGVRARIMQAKGALAKIMLLGGMVENATASAFPVVRLRRTGLASELQ